MANPLERIVKELQDAFAGLRGRVFANADELQSRPVSAEAPDNNALLGWNRTDKKWEPKTNVPCVRVYNNAATDIVDGTPTVLTFNSERFDTDTMHDTSSNTDRITFTTAGKYLVGASVLWEDTATPTGIRELRIRLNDSGTDIVRETKNASDLRDNQAISTLYDFAAGDHIDVEVQHNQGANTEIQVQDALSPEFWAVRVGPTGGATPTVGDDHGGLTGLGDDDHSLYLLATGGRAGSTGAVQDFGSNGIKADVIAESSGATGVTIDGVLLKDNGITVAANIVMGDNSVTGIDTLTFTDVNGTIAGIQNQNLVDKSAAESITGLYNFIASGVGGLGDYDATFGDVGTPDYGIIRLGDSCMGRTSHNAASLDLDGAVIFRNMGGPVTGQIEFVWVESAGASVIRFALAKRGVGNATLNPRSMLIAGPAVNDDDIVTVAYWRTNNSIFHNIDCDTSGVGADLGVQNDLEVERYIYVDELKESTTDAGIFLDGAQIKDNGIIFVEAADHPIAAAATKGQLWVKNDAPNTLWFTDDAGTDTQLGVGGGGDLATDTLWAAQGDLVKGTGDDGADILTIGADHTILVSNGSDPSWSAAPPLANIADTGDTNRITLATSGDNVTLTGEVAIAGHLDMDGADGTSEFMIDISPTTAAVTQWVGVNINPILTLTGNNRNVYGILGQASFELPSGSSGSQGFGLRFITLAKATNLSATLNTARGASVIGKIFAGATTGDTTISGDAIGLEARVDVETLNINFDATATVDDGFGIKIMAPTLTVTDLGSGSGAADITNYYGLAIEDHTTGSPTKNYLLEVGGTIGTAPYLRVRGNFTAAANATPVDISEGATPTLRQLKTKDGAAIGGGDLVCVLV